MCPLGLFTRVKMPYYEIPMDSTRLQDNQRCCHIRWWVASSTRIRWVSKEATSIWTPLITTLTSSWPRKRPRWHKHRHTTMDPHRKRRAKESPCRHCRNILLSRKWRGSRSSCRLIAMGRIIFMGHMKVSESSITSLIGPKSLIEASVVRPRNPPSNHTLPLSVKKQLLRPKTKNIVPKTTLSNYSMECSKAN